MNNESIKLQKYVSSAGLMSRRKAESEIQAGNFKINNKIATLGDRVTDSDKVYYKNKLLVNKTTPIYLLFNKPKYVVCTLDDPQGRKTIKNFLKDNQYVYPVGRLDYDTTGVLIITNDGELTNKLLHPSFEIPKTYIATLKEPLSEDDLTFLNSENVFIDGKRSLQEVLKIDDLNYKVILNEGRYHHVKNLFLEVNNKVTNLHRKQFAFLNDKNLRIGHIRPLTPGEVKKLKSLFKD